MLLMAVARSLSGDIAIRFLLLVLWMTSCLNVTVCKRRRENGVYSKWLSHGINIAAYSQTDPPGGNTGHGAESDIYDCHAAPAHPTRYMVLMCSV